MTGQNTPTGFRRNRPLIAKGRRWRHGWHLFTSWLERRHKRRPKLYPFSVPTPTPSTTSGAQASYSVEWTEWKPNPFHGIDRAA